MKNPLPVTIAILAIFLITQFFGLFVLYQYAPAQQIVINNQTGQAENITYFPEENQLPFGMQPPEQKAQVNLISLIISFALAIFIILALIKLKLKTVIRIWFLLVVILALGITINAILKNYLTGAWIASLLFAIPLACLKVFRPHYILHNLTEILVYPGIAAIFVSLFNTWWSAIIILIVISVYDMWAVWHSKIMIKMAKYQMNEAGIFAGLFIPHLTKNVRQQMKNMKKKKSKKKIKIHMGILGGGDIAFTLITAGIIMRSLGLVPALFVIFGAFVGLTYLLFKSEKKKFYPAMPFISAGIFIALLLWRLFLQG